MDDSRIISDEREDVFTQLSFIFGDEGTVRAVISLASEEGKYFLKNGSMKYEVDGDVIEISSGAYEHFLPVLREDQHPIRMPICPCELGDTFDRTFKVRLL